MKIPDYPNGTLEFDDLFLVDSTTRGTRSITANELKESIFNLLTGGSHNSIFRGKNLGEHPTAEQLTQIENGTFKDLWIGDYWESSGIRWRIAHFDYWLKTGIGIDFLSRHHVVVVPDSVLYNSVMNESASSSGYLGSSLHDTLEANGLEIALAAFPDCLMYHADSYSSNFNGSSIQYEFENSRINLMNEEMVYGCSIFSFLPSKTADSIYTASLSQFSLFKLCPEYISALSSDGSTTAAYWLHSPSGKTSSITWFCSVEPHRAASTRSDQWNSIGIRPALVIGPISE